MAISEKYKKVIAFLLPLILLVAGLYFVPIKIFETDFSKVPGDYGDARFNNYILEHGYKFVTEKVDKYWDAPFMYPYKNVIALSDNLLGTVPIYSLFRILGKDRETAFQLWLLTLFVLNFICCNWVLKRWSGNIALSATGAYIFTFSIFILGHIYNVQNFPRFIVPFVFYWSWKYLTQRQLKYFLFLCLGIVYQLYCGIYLGFFLIYALLFLFIAYFIIYRDKELISQFKSAKILSYHILIIFVAGILLAPLMLPYIDISHKMGMRSFEDTLSSIPTARSYFFTCEAPVLWKFLSTHGQKVFPQYWCHYLFMGALPWLGIIALPAIFLSSKIEAGKRKFIAFIALALLLTFIFALKINDFTLYKIIFHLPGFSAMRAINRVINTEVMLFILIFVFTFNELSKLGRVIKWFVLSFPLLIIVDNLINANELKRYDKKESQKEIEVVRKNIEIEYDKKYSAVAYIPGDIAGREIDVQINVMLASQELNIPCVNAYSGSFPGGYIDFFSHSDDKSLNQWCNLSGIDKKQIQIINDIGRKEERRKTIHLKTINGKYVCADNALNNSVIANRDNGWRWETFTLIIFENNKCAIRAFNNNFWSAESGEDNRISAKRAYVYDSETFLMVELDNNFVAFKAANGKYLTVDEKSSQLFAMADSIGDPEKFLLVVD